MSDFLLELGKNPRARNIIGKLGLPIPLPQDLGRPRGPWVERPLDDQIALVRIGPGGALAGEIAETLTQAGAFPHVVGSEKSIKPFIGPAEAFARPVTRHDVGDPPEGTRANVMVFDASGLAKTDDLHDLYDFFHPWIRRLKKRGRIVVLGRPETDWKSGAHAGTQFALDGFVRSLAKEIGKKGSTAQLVMVEQGAENRVGPVLRFLLSRRPAYVTGQTLDVTSVCKASQESVPFVRPLENKVALVTGAARGIGTATVQRLAEEGASVICLDRPEDDGPISRIAREINGSVLAVDVTEKGASKQIIKHIKDRYGKLDIVVHNAGITRDKTIANMSDERWSQTIEVNLAAVIRITKSLTEGPLSDDGRIICLSSIAGIAGNNGQTNYAASKSGLIGYVSYLAKDMAKRGITVNAVAPGFIETRLTDAIPTAIREVARRLNNLGQGGLPVDIAEVITFLASPGAHGLTGSTIRVCG